MQSEIVTANMNRDPVSMSVILSTYTVEINTGVHNLPVTPYILRPQPLTISKRHRGLLHMISALIRSNDVYMGADAEYEDDDVVCGSK